MIIIYANMIMCIYFMCIEGGAQCQAGPKDNRSIYKAGPKGGRGPMKGRGPICDLLCMICGILGNSLSFVLTVFSLCFRYF